MKIGSISATLSCSTLIWVLSTGCATPYQADAWYRQGGFSETNHGGGRWSIDFRGNENTDLERTMDFSLLRAAELCLADGYAYVELLNSESIFDAYDEEVTETVVEDDEEVEYTRTETITTPRSAREIACRATAAEPLGQSTNAPARIFSATFLHASTTNKYDL